MEGFIAAWDILERAYKGPPADSAKFALAKRHENPSLKAARSVAGVFGHELTESESRWAAPAVQYLTGTALGALYGGFADPAAQAGSATAYGAAVWFAADRLALPALGLASNTRRVNRTTAEAKMLAARLVYSATTHLVRKLLLTPSRTKR
jgi:hypothetical protein